MLQPPDAQHEWRFDANRREWFYLVNGNQRVYHNSTPRVLPNARPPGSGQQFQTASDYQVTPGPSIGTGGTPPIPIRSGSNVQSGASNFVGSPQPVTGFSPSSLGAGRFLSQNSPSGPSFGSASPPANLLPTGIGRGGGFSPPANVVRTGSGRGGYVPPANSPPATIGRGAFIPPTNPPPSVAGRGAYVPPTNLPPPAVGRGGGYIPPINPLPKGSKKSGGYIPPAGGPRPSHVSSSSTQAAGGSSQPTEEEKRQILDADYKVRERPRKFFRLGKVFLKVHTEDLGGKKGQSTAFTFNKDAFPVAFGEMAFSKVRRFVVVSEQADSCSALAITTHSGKGAAKRNAAEHGIMYTGSEAPPPLKNEGMMSTKPIRIDPFNRFDILHPASRVNYAKTYNIEHNVKVKPYGMVNALFMHHLVKQWTEVIIGRSITPIQVVFREINPANLRALGFTSNMMTAVFNMMNRPKGPSANSQTAVVSVARDSARNELQSEQADASENLANHVVDLIQAGMRYPQAVGHVRRLHTNGLGVQGENDAVGEGAEDEEEDEEEDEQEEESDEASSSSEEESDAE